MQWWNNFRPKERFCGIVSQMLGLRYNQKMDRSLTQKFITTPLLAELSATLLMFVGGFWYQLWCCFVLEGNKKSFIDSERGKKGLKTIFLEVFFESKKILKRKIVWIETKINFLLFRKSFLSDLEYLLWKMNDIFLFIRNKRSQKVGRRHRDRCYSWIESNRSLWECFKTIFFEKLFSFKKLQKIQVKNTLKSVFLLTKLTIFSQI